MKKKGFTLIEIIVSIGVLAILGVASFFGVRFVTNNIRINKLEEIEDKIVNAVSVYIETNEEARNNLYESKNGVYVPLNVLQNEGLIDFQDIKITDKDYVITMLGSADKNGACIDTTTIGSWDDGNKTIYLCTTSSGTTNVSTVGFACNNLSLISKNRVWFCGTPSASEGIRAGDEARTNNYVMYNGNGPYNIYYIDRDDSIALVSHNSFENVFNGKTQKVSSDKRNINCNFTGTDNVWTKLIWERHFTNGDKTYILAQKTDELVFSDGEMALGMEELEKTGLLYSSISGIPSNLIGDTNVLDKLVDDGLLCMSDNSFYQGRYDWIYYVSYKDDKHAVKIQLKPCMKISSGNGTIEVPYQITDYCS